MAIFENAKLSFTDAAKVVFLWVTLYWAGAPLVMAHNIDTSYARVQLDSEHLNLRLTYDLFTLNKIVPLDENGDQQIAKAELAKQAPIILKFLREHVRVEINERESELGESLGYTWPSAEAETIPERDYHSAVALVHFSFRKAVSDLPQDVNLDFSFFETFGERHRVLGTFEHGTQKDEVMFNQFEPDFLYDTGYQPSAGKQLVKFLKLGIEHIFLGYDHICFLIALILLGRLGELIKIVTSFTIAHSITLILAALELVKLPPVIIESGIAVTIMYVALENLWVKNTHHRWMLTFGFGLVHGFGFANVLKEMGLPSQGVVRCLLSFNVGVELGQLVIVLVLLPLSLALAKWKHGRRTMLAISTVIFLLGLAWFAERALGLSIMPF